MVSAQSFNPFEAKNAQQGKEWRTALIDSVNHLPDSIVDERLQDFLAAIEDLNDIEALGWYYELWGTRMENGNPARAVALFDIGIKLMEENGEKAALVNLYISRIPLYHSEEVELMKKCLDRVKELTKGSDNPKLKLNMHQLYTAYYAKRHDVEKQIWHARNAVRFARKHGSTGNIAGTQMNLAMCHLVANNLDSAFYHINKSLATHSIGAKEESMALLQRGRINDMKGQLDDAAADISRAYLIFDSVNDIRGVLLSSEMLARIYSSQKNYDQALKIRLRNRNLLIKNKSPLSRYYLKIAITYAANKQFNEARLYSDSTDNALKGLPNAEISAKLLSTKGNISLYYGDTKKALSQMFSAAERLGTLGAFYDQNVQHYALAGVYVKLLEKDSFIALPKHGIEKKANLIPIFKRITDDIESAQNPDYNSFQTFKIVGLLYEANEEYKTANRYLKLSAKMRDSLLKQEQSKTVSKLNEKTRELAAERSEAESRSKAYAARLESKHQRTVKYWAISIAGLLVILVLFVIYQLRKNKQHTAQLEEQKQVIEQQRDQLEELDELKSIFFANISHELRTPLTLILGPITDIVKKRTADLPKEVNQLMQLAFRNGNKLQELVNEILDLGKLEVGELKIEYSTVDMNQFTRRVFYTFESLAVLKSIKLTLDYQLAQPASYYVDANRLDKILSNLMSNALKFTSNNGEIILQVSSQEEQIAFIITDTGAGIHPDDLEKVFDRYYQSGHQKEGAGTGIGLSFAWQLAELLGGTLNATSELGKGSTFTLLLPLAPSSDPVVNIEEKEEESNPFIPVIPENLGSNTSILVVEDNPEMQQYIETTLSSHFHVILANNGIEAIAQLETKHFDLILSDLMMPQMDGMELLEIVKENNDWKNTPFVMLTARAADKDRLKALNVGLDDYLLKPFITDELVVRISNLISNNRERTGDELEENEDQQWLQKVQTLTSERLTDKDFNVTTLAEELLMGERQIYRQMKKLTGLTPNKFIQEMRLRQAREYLECGSYKTVTEISLAVGFDTVQYFSKLYLQRFGKRPTEYLH